MTRRPRVGNPAPAYYRLQREIQKDIETGKLSPGERIPAERWLAEAHGVSVGTVTKAILNLVHEGYLHRVQGSGTFVSGTNLKRESLRYYRYRSDFGDDESDLRVELLHRASIMAPGLIARRLRIPEESAVYELKRLLASEDGPMVFSVSYLPGKMFTGFEEMPSSRLERVPLYMTIEEEYKIPTVLNRELISAISVDADVSAHLGLEPGSPILLIEMLAFTYKEKPYEYRKSYCSTFSRKILREY
jgi:DNA-binding GntR family transcriptional regulator